MNATIIVFKIVMNSRKDEEILYYVREQGLGMAAALLTMMYKKRDTIKTLGLFRKCPDCAFFLTSNIWQVTFHTP